MVSTSRASILHHHLESTSGVVTYWSRGGSQNIARRNSTSTEQSPDGICCTGEQPPSRPKEHEEDGVSAAENKNSKLVPELLTQPPDLGRCPNTSSSFTRHVETVKSGIFGDEVDVRGQDSRCVQAGRNAKTGKEAGSDADEEGD